MSDSLSTISPPTIPDNPATPGAVAALPDDGRRYECRTHVGWHHKGTVVSARDLPPHTQIQTLIDRGALRLMSKAEWERYLLLEEGKKREAERRAEANHAGLTIPGVPLDNNVELASLGGLVMPVVKPTAVLASGQPAAVPLPASVAAINPSNEVVGLSQAAMQAEMAAPPPPAPAPVSVAAPAPAPAPAAQPVSQPQASQPQAAQGHKGGPLAGRVR